MRDILRLTPTMDNHIAQQFPSLHFTWLMTDLLFATKQLKQLWSLAQLALPPNHHYIPEGYGNHQQEAHSNQITLQLAIYTMSKLAICSISRIYKDRDIFSQNFVGTQKYLKNICGDTHPGAHQTDYADIQLPWTRSSKKCNTWAPNYA